MLGQIPVMPLTPSHGVGRIICGSDLQRSCGVLSVRIDRYGSAVIRCVKKIESIGSRVRHVDRYVEPLSRFGPANIWQVSRRNNLVEGVIVNSIWLPFEFRVGSIHSLMDAKFIEVGPVGRIQLSAAVILGVGIVIGNSFATQVVIGT